MILQLYIIGVVSTLFDNTHGLTVSNQESKMKASKTKQLYFRTTGNSYITFCVLIFLNIIKNKNILYICNTVYHKKIIGISQFALLKKIHYQENATIRPGFEPRTSPEYS